tara:strand:+ start:4204 stop:4644 length:441 start_codon:yes stop_codon:yes gene_type:complete
MYDYEETEEVLTVNHDVRDLLLRYEDAECPCCGETLTFEQPGDIVEAYCGNPSEEACFRIWTKFEEAKPKEGSLEEWLGEHTLTKAQKELGDVMFGKDTVDEIIASQTGRIIAWWQQADKPWRGHDAKKNANEIALEAIEKLFKEN